MSVEPLAHSAPEPGREPQLYRDHVGAVRRGAELRAARMTAYQRDKAAATALFDAVVDAAIAHDLGKLDPETQQQLRQGRGTRLTWDHVDAGVAYSRAHGAYTAAWLVRSHHAPGLPSLPVHFQDPTDRKLRGRRNDTEDEARHAEQVSRTDAHLEVLVEAHSAACGVHTPKRGKAMHGLSMRLALSALVDADHADTAAFDTGWSPPEEPPPRWEERLAALDAYVADLGKRDGGERDGLRRDFYRACRDQGPAAALVACEGPVGIGKTTAVTAYLLRRAIATGARRLFIVAPYTAILSQTAERLREALVLEDERDRPDAIVAEHHHRASFDHVSSRDLAALWSAPVVLTTSVQFFETLAAAEPAILRKLHALPGSVVFLDEAHAALPTHLWPQNWRWLRELAEDWSCSFVFASGSLVRFWEIDDIVGDARMILPELVSPTLATPMLRTEAGRVRYETAPHFETPAALAAAVAAAPGPRLLIMNTVQSAAVMARLMRAAGDDVLHLSTALCPRDRDALLADIRARLGRKRYDEDWTLVATSLMEAGVDVSFRTAFRERFSVTSLIQIGGRANREFEYPGGVTVYDFVVSHVDGLRSHPAATVSADVLADLLAQGRLDGAVAPADVVTTAMRLELRRGAARRRDELLHAERHRLYPEVASLGKVIDVDTRLVVVDRGLRERLSAREPVPVRAILDGSVQIWAEKIDHLALPPVSERREIYWWPYRYDPGFLGYMDGALGLVQIERGETTII